MVRFLESPGKPWNLVFASPGKNHLNVCMNPDTDQPSMHRVNNITEISSQLASSDLNNTVELLTLQTLSNIVQCYFRASLSGTTLALILLLLLLFHPVSCNDAVVSDPPCILSGL